MASGTKNDPNRGDARARDTLATAAPFRTATMRAATRASERVIDRWAPEERAERRVRSLGLLGFADRLLAPYVAQAQLAQKGPTVAARRDVPQPSWLFPFPWYQDELNWRAAAEHAQEGALPAVSAPALGAVARSPALAVAPPMVMATGSPVAPAPALRTWLPLVPFAAARAAEVFAGAAQRDASDEHPTPRLASLPALEVVAPRDAGGAARVALAPAAQVRRDQAERPAAAPAPATPVPAAPSAPAVRPADAVPASAARLGAGSDAAPAPLSARGQPSGSPGGAVALASSPTTTRSSEGVTARVGGETEAPAAFPAAHPPAAAVPLPAMTAAELLDRTAAGDRFEPSAGPRVALPVDLGGLVASVEAARQVAAPMDAGATVRSRAPVAYPVAPELVGLSVVRVAPEPRAWAEAAIGRDDGPATALGGLAARMPRGLHHMAWSDRWLARFAGASAETLATLDVGPSRRWLERGAPSPIFVAPREDAASPARRSGEPRVAAVPSGAMGASAPVVSPQAGTATLPALRIADDEPVSDEVFAAIARAAAGVAPAPRPEPAAAVSADRPAPAPGPTPRPGLGATPADRALGGPRGPVGAGLRTAMAASPVAAALRGALALPVAAPFDVRALVDAGSASGPFTIDETGAITRAVARPLGLAGVAPAMGVLGVGAWPPATAARVEGDGPIGAPSNLVTATTAASTAPVAPIATTARMDVGAAGEPRAGSATVPGGRRWSGLPGGLAESAREWSLEHEREAADLSFDFVEPELVLAAQVYGFGAAEAASAARLGGAGRAGLTQLASAIDLAFVAAVDTAGGAQRAARIQRESAAAMAGGAATATAVVPAAATPASANVGDAPWAAPVAGPALSGPRRMPRGAFLWPRTTLEALGVRAVDVEQSHPHARAALDLLAAHLVIEAGQAAAQPETELRGAARWPTAPGPAAAVPGEALDGSFEAIYLALSESPEGRSLAPSARAARALAIAHRAGGDAPASARTRAAAAWAVMPMVLTGDGGADAAAAGASAAPAGATLDPATSARAHERASLELLSSPAARAGAALQSLVASPPAREAGPGRTEGAVHRAPTAAPELVRTGPAGSKTGSSFAVPQATGAGETTVPPWFEEAARRIFKERPEDGGISLAEMTLVTAAPARQVAASMATANQAPAPAPQHTPRGDVAGAGEPPDVDALAEEVYDQLMRMMEIARERSGDPWRT